MSAFSVNIRGVTVTCETVGELDVLISRYGAPVTYIHGASAGERGCKAWKHPSRPSWDSGPIIENAKWCALHAGHAYDHNVDATAGAILFNQPSSADDANNFKLADAGIATAGIEVKPPQPRLRVVSGTGTQVSLDDGKTWINTSDYLDVVKPRHVSAACEIRETIGIVKPHEAEWTWEYAIDSIKALVVNRNMWQARSQEVTMQRERCDRIIVDLREQVRQADARVLDAQAVITGLTATDVSPPSPGKLAEKIIYALLKDIVEHRPILRDAWSQYSPKSNAEFTTLWIEKAEAILKGESK